MVLNLGCFPLLLMLLGLWSTVCPLCAWPENITKAHWFEIQHIQPNLLQCNRAMGVVNNYDQYCKPKNTFLHDSFQNVAVVCKLPNIKCRDGCRNNCHQSAKPVNMTICRLTSGKYPYCVYSDTAQYRVFIVACDPPQEGDPPYPLVPVHLDGLI